MSQRIHISAAADWTRSSRNEPHVTSRDDGKNNEKAWKEEKRAEQRALLSVPVLQGKTWISYDQKQSLQSFYDFLWSKKKKSFMGFVEVFDSPRRV